MVDKEIARVIGQNKNLVAKMDAVKEYNKLKQRITEKSEVTVITPTPIFSGLSVSNKE